MATNTSGGKVAGSDTRYTPFGETRDSYAGESLPTDRRYTGQREVADLGLYDYAARYYDPYIGRFIQADTIIPDPGSAQSYNRYSYVDNNPLRWIDSTGHSPMPPSKSGTWPWALFQLTPIPSWLFYTQLLHEFPASGAAISFAVGKIEDNYNFSLPSDMNKSIHGAKLVRKYHSLIINASEEAGHDLITPALLSAIVRTQGGSNYPLMGTPEHLQSTLGICSGACSLGITQMDVGNALHLQKLGLMPSLGGEAETSRMLISNPEANLRYMTTMLVYGDQLLIDFWQTHNMGMPSDQIRLELMASLQNGSISGLEATISRFTSANDFWDWYNTKLSQDKNIPKVLPWLPWGQNILNGEQ